MTFQQICFEGLKNYATENRFNNLVTKYVDDWLNAEITKDLELLLVHNLANDIETDYIKDHKLDNNFSIDYVNSNEKQLNGFLIGFVKKMIKNRNL
jgi:hypothetical protein